MLSFLVTFSAHFFHRFGGPSGPHFLNFFVPQARRSYTPPTFLAIICPSALPSPEILQKWPPKGPPKVPKRCPGDPRSLKNTSTSIPKASKQDYKTTSLQYSPQKKQNYKTTRPSVMQCAGLLLGVGLVGQRGAYRIFLCVAEALSLAPVRHSIASS